MTKAEPHEQKKPTLSSNRNTKAQFRVEILNWDVRWLIREDIYTTEALLE